MAPAKKRRATATSSSGGYQPGKAVPKEAKIVNGLPIPKLSSPNIELVEEGSENAGGDETTPDATATLITFASQGFQCFVAKFSADLLEYYKSEKPEFDAYPDNEVIPAPLRRLHLIRAVWLALKEAEHNTWERSPQSANYALPADEGDGFDAKLAEAILDAIQSHSEWFLERRERENKLAEFIKANEGIFVSSGPREFVVDYSPMVVSPHAIELFKMLLPLDYFLDAILASDKSRTLAMIKHCIKYRPSSQTSPGDEDAQLLEKLDALLPGWKESGQLEAWILPSLKEHSGHINPRELSAFPLTALEIYLRQMNGIEFSAEQSRHARRQCVELGVLDAILQCLSYFDEHKHRFEPLRHSLMPHGKGPGKGITFTAKPFEPAQQAMRGRRRRFGGQWNVPVGGASNPGSSSGTSTTVAEMPPYDSESDYDDYYGAGGGGDDFYDGMSVLWESGDMPLMPESNAASDFYYDYFGDMASFGSSQQKQLATKSQPMIQKKKPPISLPFPQPLPKIPKITTDSGTSAGTSPVAALSDLEKKLAEVEASMSELKEKLHGGADKAQTEMADQMKAMKDEELMELEATVVKALETLDESKSGDAAGTSSKSHHAKSKSPPLKKPGVIGRSKTTDADELKKSGGTKAASTPSSPPPPLPKSILKKTTPKLASGHMSPGPIPSSFLTSKGASKKTPAEFASEFVIPSSTSLSKVHKEASSHIDLMLKSSYKMAKQLSVMKGKMAPPPPPLPKKGMTSTVATWYGGFGPSPSSSGASTSKAKDNGVGFGDGSTHSEWSIQRYHERKSWHMRQVAAILNALKSFIQPLKDEVLTDELKVPIEDEVAILLYRSCLRETLSSFLSNDSFIDITNNKGIYESVLALLIALSNAKPVLVDDDSLRLAHIVELISVSDPSSNKESSKGDSGEKASTSSSVVGWVKSLVGGLVASTSKATSKPLRSEGQEAESGEIDDYEEPQSNTAPPQPSLKGDKELKEIDIFHLLFLGGKPSGAGDAASDETAKDTGHPILENMRRLDKQITEYLKRISSSLEQFQFMTEEQLSDKDIESIVEGNEEKSTLEKLSEMSRVACEIISEKISTYTPLPAPLPVQHNTAATTPPLASDKAAAPVSSLTPSSEESTPQRRKSARAAAAQEKANANASDSTSSQGGTSPSGSKASAGEQQMAAEAAAKEIDYCRAMKTLQFESIAFLQPGGQWLVPYHYARSINTATPTTFGKQMRKIAQEMVLFNNSSLLPLSSSSSVFVRSSEERIDVLKFMITGPSGTPYANGCFEFDVLFPDDYPNSPMQVNLETTGNRSVRFNPNLYNCGKVCLSILNTWSGRPEERWNPSTSSLYQVIVSLQSLVLVPDPYFNEPGFAKSAGTAHGRRESAEYNVVIKAATVRWAMLESLLHPPVAFADVIREHFLHKREEIKAQVEQWIRENDQVLKDRPSTHRGYGMHQPVENLKKNADAMKKSFESLKVELDKLKPKAEAGDTTVVESADDGSVVDVPMGE